MAKEPAVYILSNKKHGTLYIGVTSNLIQRIYQHKNNLVTGFSQKYGTHMLVYYEQHECMENALNREKKLKKWNRQWKINLIETDNPNWLALYPGLV